MSSRNKLLVVTNWADRAMSVNWNVTSLAKDCAVSLSTLERHFRDYLGRDPHELIAAERMRRSRELLKRNERIKDIAVTLCYGHQRNFTSAFTKFHGYPPSEHRERAKNGECSEH